MKKIFIVRQGSQPVFAGSNLLASYNYMKAQVPEQEKNKLPSYWHYWRAIKAGSSYEQFLCGTGVFEIIKMPVFKRYPQLLTT